MLSYEPLVAVIDENQSHLLDLVNATIGILKTAAELGVTSQNADAQLNLAYSGGSTAEVRRLFQLDPFTSLAKIGLNTERIRLILTSIGNLEEIIQRSIHDPNQNTMPLSGQLSRPI
jgi:hypothetical protein